MIGGLFEHWFRGQWREQRSSDWTLSAVGWSGNTLMAQGLISDLHAKQGRTTGRWLAPTPTRPSPVYLKRHYHLPLRLRLLAWLWPWRAWSPAWLEWRHLNWARRRGVPVPEPLAVGERRGPGLTLQSYLVVRELTGMLPLHEAVPKAAAILAPDRFADWKRDLIRELADVTRKLHQARRYHKDFYLCHFFVPANTLYNGRVPHGTLHLIDFHRLVHSPLLGWRWRVKDLAELLFSSEIAGVNDRDRLRFFQRYRGRRRRSLGMRWLARWVRWKARRYLAHNRRVQCRKQLQPGQKPTLPLALPSEGRTP